MYSDHFGLTAPPFQLTPDARFWYASRTHRKAMAYLGYGLAQSEGFIVVTGEIGAGKSTLVGYLLATIDRSRLSTISVVTTQVGGDDMLRLVAQGLGVATGGVEKARLIEAVERRFEEEARSGKRSLIVVDEAQNLSVEALEELRMLSNFQIAGRALVQILLLGQPEFRDKLAGEGLEQLRQRVIANHHLDAMDADEVQAYVGHRLTVAGWNGRPGFTVDAFPAIHRHSGGIPRRVNQIANRLMLYAAVENVAAIDSRAVEAVVADMKGEKPIEAPSPAPAPSPVPPTPVVDRILPLRAVASAPAPEPEAPPAPDRAIERRVEELEQQLGQQEAALRRVLSMLVDWVESGADERGYRSSAA
jgi:putative secretion ATPase (PEP-CTERM system associated)